MSLLDTEKRRNNYERELVSKIVEANERLKNDGVPRQGCDSLNFE